MSGRMDLTRWNRAGLSSFRYVDGNAVNWLEMLRAALSERFPEWEDVQAEHASASERELLSALLNQYHGERRDMLWEITRSFARAAHVLTESLDACANESYIGTVTQWDNLRRLVEMLDYHPASPASAVVALALIAKQAGDVHAGLQVKHMPTDGSAAVIFETLDDIGVTPVLNQLHPKAWNKSQALLSADTRWISAQGKPLGELEISCGELGLLLNTDSNRADVVALNAVHAAENRLSFAYPGLAGAGQWKEHQSMLLLGAKDVRPFKLRGKGVVRLSTTDNKPHKLSVNDVIAWQDHGAWIFNEVSASDDCSVRLADPNLMPSRFTHLYRLACIDAGASASFSADKIVFPLLSGDSSIAAGRWLNGELLALNRSDYEKVAHPDFAKKTHNQLKHNNISKVYVKYSSDKPAATVQSSELAEFIVDGSSKGLNSGDWIIAEGGKNQSIRYAMQIATIVEQENSFVLGFSAISNASAGGAASEPLMTRLRNIQVALDESILIGKTVGFFIDGRAAELGVAAIQGIGETYAAALGKGATLRDLSALDPSDVPGISPIRLMEFKTKADLVLGFSVSEADSLLAGKLVYDLLALPQASNVSTPADNAINAISRFHGPFALALLPEGYDQNRETLKRTKTIALEAVPDELAVGRKVLLVCGEQALASSIVAIDVESDSVTLAHDIDQETYVKSETLLMANVVRSGHGESQPERVLGSGDATRSNQSFLFKQEGVSFIPDATMSTGVRVAVDVAVDGRIWTQVASLNDSGPVDMHYCVRMTEEGYLRICFGDGQHGRRLPGGTNNLRISWRKGNGLEGNLAAGCLEKPVKPHRLLASIRQPQGSSGGADIEGLDSIRANAPSSLRSMERAVSTSDFKYLAAGLSTVWQASAFALTSGLSRQQKMEVVVVPSGGTALAHESQTSLQAYLEQYALPGTIVKVTGFERVKLAIDVTIQVKTEAFDPEKVKQAVRQALLQALALKQRQLGKALYRADLYQIVESVQGVENSKCTILPGMKVTNSRGDVLRDAVTMIHANGDIRCIKASERELIYLPDDALGLTLDDRSYTL